VEFREEFYALVRNDEIYARLFSLHLFLLADRLKQSSVTFSLRDKLYWQHKYAVFVLSTRSFPKRFYLQSYGDFHGHLPEELFLTDFTQFIKRTNAQTYKAYSKVFATTASDQASKQASEQERANEDEFRARLRDIVYKITLDSQLHEENPLVDKLTLYVSAHRNYL